MSASKIKVYDLDLILEVSFSMNLTKHTNIEKGPSSDGVLHGICDLNAI
jgi:hypothetical protein